MILESCRSVLQACPAACRVPADAGSVRVLPAQACLHKVLTVRHATLAGFWPIPEAFRLEPGLTSLPPRLAQPSLAYLPQARGVGFQAQGLPCCAC